MYRGKILALALLFTLTFATGTFITSVSCVPPFQPRPPPNIRPIIFVHGGSGSAQQFESQAMRFTSNGYPPSYLWALEYDSSFTIEKMADVWGRLDELISAILAETGAEKVDLIGHSLGTRVLLDYMGSPERRAKVAYYINIDGSSGRSAPEGVPTLAIWGEGSTTRQIVGAVRNVYFSSQSHVQVCTSAEAFVEMYKFLTGYEPFTKDIIPEPPGQVWISGRVVIFPLNVYIEYPEGCPGVLEIWQVDGNTGYRIYNEPNATFVIQAPDGRWGPFKAKGGVHYEFCLIREGLPPHHFYREPFIRSNYWISLHTSLPGGIADYMNRGDRHSNLVIVRNMELWGNQGADNDILTINGINIITAPICPRTKRVNAMFVYDKDADGQSDLTKPIAYYYAFPFMTGADLYIPAADPPNGTISLVLTPRGGGGKTQVINIPNWASSKHRISVQFNDYIQEINSFQEYMRAWRPFKHKVIPT